MDSRSHAAVTSTDPRVQAALQDYLGRIDRGERIEVEAFVAQHADVADELRLFIAFDEEARRSKGGPAPKAGPSLTDASAIEPPRSKAEVSTHSVVGKVVETVKPTPGKQVPKGEATAAAMARRSVVASRPKSAPLPKSPSDLPESFGRYQVKQKLGEGAMGAVYLAEDSLLQRKVALKTPTFEDDTDGELLKRFYREARAVASLKHPNLCAVYDVGEIGGRHYISMEFVPGKKLQEFIKPDKPMTEKQAMAVVRKIALGMHEAHAHGVIHRDLKPDNIMVNEKGEPVVMDFGLVHKTDQQNSTKITQRGTLVGSPAYMSKEQVEGDPDKLTGATDQYSLGVILYQLLTSKLPFEGGIHAVLGAILVKEPPPPSQYRPDLNPHLEAVCLKMMAKEATDRYPSMKAAADALAEVAKGTSKAAGSVAASAPIARSLTDGITATFAGIPIPPEQEQKSPFDFVPTGTLTVPQFKGKMPKQVFYSSLAAGLVLLLAVTLWFRNGDALVKVTIDSDDVEVTFQDQTIKVKDGTHEYKITPGDHKLHIKSANIVFDTESFTLKKGENPAVTVELVKSEVVAKVGGKEVGRRSLTTSVSGKSREKVESSDLNSRPNDRDPAGLNSPQFSRNQQLIYVLATGGLATRRFDGQKPTSFKLEGRLPITFMNWKTETQSLLVLSENRFLTITSTDEEPKELYRLPESAYYGAIHPSQDRLAWCRRRSSGHGEVIVSKLDGTEETHHVDGYEPCWTGDGQKLVYTGWHDSAWAIGVHEGTQTRYLKTPTHPNVSVCPAPSPDGKQIAFTMKGDDGTMQIGLMSIDGSNVRQLTRTGNNVWSTFSPDGRFIAFIRGNASPASVVVVDVQTGEETIIANDARPIRPVWHAVVPGDKNPPSANAKEQIAAIKNGDFSDGLNGWQKEGNASDFKVYPLPSGGNYMTTHNGRYDAQGRLFQSFEVPDNATVLEFFVHGGDSPNMSVGLIENGKGIYRVTGKNTNDWSPVAWDVSKLRGKQVTLEIVDQLVRRSWGHFGAYGFKILRKTGDSTSATTLPKPNANEQITTFVKELKRLNPGYNGEPTYAEVDGIVTDLNFDSLVIEDLRPVTAFSELKVLNCMGSIAASGWDPGTAKLNILGPLQGLRLEQLDARNTHIRSLEPLRGMPLTHLYLSHTNVADLSPLKGMPLTHLRCGSTKVSSLESLRGMQLEELWVPLTQVTDLGPIKGMPLKKLSIVSSPIADVTLLKGMQLEELGISPDLIKKGMSVFREMNSLKTMFVGWGIGDQFSAPEFWRLYDARKWGIPNN